MHQVTDWLRSEAIRAALADYVYVLCTSTQRDVIMSAMSSDLRPPNSSASIPLDGTCLRINPGKCTWLAPLCGCGTVPVPDTSDDKTHPSAHAPSPSLLVPAGPVPVPSSTSVTTSPTCTDHGVGTGRIPNSSRIRTL
eukprot:scaffold436432_cov48-Prasinocladus_malaysianus.AAC.1